MEVVGVIADAKYNGVRDPILNTVYLPAGPTLWFGFKTKNRGELRRPQPHQISESGVLRAKRRLCHTELHWEIEKRHCGRSEMTSKRPG